MPMVGMARSLGHLRREVPRDALEDDRKGPGVLKRPGVVEQALPIGGAPSLHLDPAELVHGLRCQAEVAHHRDPPLREPRDRLDDPATALELDGVHARLEVFGGVDDGVLAGPLVRAEGQVPDEELLRRASRDSPGVVEHLGHGHRMVLA